MLTESTFDFRDRLDAGGSIPRDRHQVEQTAAGVAITGERVSDGSGCSIRAVPLETFERDAIKRFHGHCEPRPRVGTIVIDADPQLNPVLRGCWTPTGRCFAGNFGECLGITL